MEADGYERAAINLLVEKHGMWGEHPDFTHSMWCHQVVERQTLLGYWHWVVRMRIARTQMKQAET